MIFLIQELWIDPLENYSAIGYRTIGYVLTEEEANRILQSSGTVKGTGWPIEVGQRFEKLRAMRVEAYPRP